MKKHLKRFARAAAAAFLLTCSHTSVRGQVGRLENLGQLEGRGTIKAVVSMRTHDRLYVAIWYAAPSAQAPHAPENSLRVYERGPGGYVETFRFDDRGHSTWEHLSSFDSPRLPGFVLFNASGASDRGPATVVGLVGNKFQVVYEGGESEFVDLNADGIAEIFESVWPDGDGFPRSTTVHLWDGRSYKRLMTVGWPERFSTRVRKSVEKAAPKAQNNF